ncbi:MAG: beta-lactamase family protein [Clostridia bacterium]|nr:beta-lactamase family protein [Clostridia bacterium]
MNFSRLRDFLDYYLPMLGVPGSDTVIYRDHQQIFRHQSGYDNLKYRTPMRSDAIHHLYSCTKIVTCVCALQLIERGEILINDPIHVYFPEYKNLKVARRGSDGKIREEKAKNPMLIRHLFSMTSGLDYNIRRSSIERVKSETDGRCPTLDIIRALPDDPLVCEPGEKYCYGLSHDVLGGLVELISGMKLGDYMKKNVFDPLGMKDTTFEIGNNNYERIACQYDYDSVGRCAVDIPKDSNIMQFGSEYQSGGAGLLSTVDDFILLTDALANGGVGKNGARILSGASVELLRASSLTPEQSEGFEYSFNVGYHYGLGVRVMSDPAKSGSLVPKGAFGWDGKKMCLSVSDPKNKIAIFHAEEIDGMNPIIIPRLLNVIYSCFDDI